MTEFFMMLESPIPEWMTMFDVGMLFFMGIAVGIMLGHKLGKGGG